MNEQFEIRLYDKPLLTFGFTVDDFGKIDANITAVHSEQYELFPIGIRFGGGKLPNADLSDWLRRRVIPKNRAFVTEILRSFNLKANDTRGIIEVCKGLSLNDSYWVVSAGFEGRFANYNLYENRFSEILSLVAYTGVDASDAAFSTSPELTTGGMLPKAWRFIEGDGIYLYKGGTSGTANAGLEPYSEYYASQIAEAMELNAVRYDLENWKGILASKCKLFTDIDTSFVPIGRIVTSGGLSATMKFYDAHGQVFADSIRDMLVFDAVIYNCDRHYGNFGVLRSNADGKIVAPAPIFDNGVSLFNYAMRDDFNDLERYAESRFPAEQGTTFESIVRAVKTPRQTEKLRKLIDFKFNRGGGINLPEWRLSAIEKHLHKRVIQLLNVPLEQVKPNN